MSGHTAGPWTLGDLTKATRHMLPTAVFKGEQLIATCGGYSDNRVDGNELANQQLANARLITAAPELLEALVGILAHGEWDATICADCAELTEQARAAIAKALGQPS